eukprot:851165-Rhodomonas_salina.3
MLLAHALCVGGPSQLLVVGQGAEGVLAPQEGACLLAPCSPPHTRLGQLTASGARGRIPMHLNAHARSHRFGCACSGSRDVVSVAVPELVLAWSVSTEGEVRCSYRHGYRWSMQQLITTT